MAAPVGCSAENEGTAGIFAFYFTGDFERYRCVWNANIVDSGYTRMKSFPSDRLVGTSARWRRLATRWRYGGDDANRIPRSSARKGIWPPERPMVPRGSAVIYSLQTVSSCYSLGMTLPYEVTKIESVGDLVDGLASYYDDDQVVWFRGQADASWKLLPSLARRGGLADEKALRSQFQRDAVPLLSKASIPGGLDTDWDWMFLMQHYGVPTRLLDWSENALTGLWFAVNDAHAHDSDAALWALDPQKLNTLNRIFAKKPWDLPFCGDKSGDAENFTTAALDDGPPGRRLYPLAVIAERRFDRVVAQQGVFTVMHKDATPLEDLGDSSHVQQFVIPKDARTKIGAELTRLGVTEISLFPDLQRLGALVSGRI